MQATVTLTGKGAGNKQGLCTLVPGGTCPYGAWTKTPGAVSVAYGTNVQFLIRPMLPEEIDAVS